MATKRKPTEAASQTPPAPPTEYEQGVMYVLELLRKEVSRLSDAQREAMRLLWHASPEVQSFLNFASPATNIAGDVENRVVKEAVRHLSARRMAEKEGA